MDKLKNVAIPAELLVSYFSPVLIIDNEDLTPGGNLALFRELGFRKAESVCSEEQARQHLRAASKIRLIVLDLSMPGLDGIALIKDIVQLHPYCAVIISSSLEENLLRTAQRLAESYAANVLLASIKPIQKNQLLSCLSREFFANRAIEKGVYGSCLQSGSFVVDHSPNFTLHFQPKICLRSGRVVGGEALARFEMEGAAGARTLLPAYFISHFQRAGRMPELTVQVVKKAMDTLQFLNSRDVFINMSINVSISDLAEPSFPLFVEQEIASRRISPDQLTFEVGEASLFGNIDACGEAVFKLRSLGCDVALDDFGGGQVNLNQLSRLPFTELKIDQSFIRRALSDKEAYTALEDQLRAASSLRLRVVAEGIETEADRALVSHLGIEFGQGYLFSRAKPEKYFVDGILQDSKNRPPAAMIEPWLSS